MDKQERLQKFIAEHPKHKVAIPSLGSSRSMTAIQVAMARIQSPDYKPYSPSKAQLVRSSDRIHRSPMRPYMRKRTAKSQRELEARALRIERIVALRLEGKTLRAIGADAAVGLTCERIRQILMQVAPELAPRRVKVDSGLVTLTCLRCGKSFERNKNRLRKRNYCGKDCVGLKSDPRDRARAHAKWRYHNDPDYRERHRLASQKYSLTVRNTPEFKKHQREYLKGYFARKKQDPVWAAKHRAKNAAEARKRAEMKVLSDSREIENQLRSRGIL